jgi:hypothetical protein
MANSHRPRREAGCVMATESEAGVGAVMERSQDTVRSKAGASARQPELALTKLPHCAIRGGACRVLGIFVDIAATKPGRGAWANLACGM